MSTEIKGWCLAILFTISFTLGVFLRNYLYTRFDESKVKEKIRLLGYLKNSMCKYPQHGLCNASNMLLLTQSIGYREERILKGLILEFKPNNTWNDQYYFEPGDYISRLDWCDNVIKQLDAVEVK